MKIHAHAPVQSSMPQNNIKNAAATSAQPRPAATPATPISEAQQALRALPELDNQQVTEMKAVLQQGHLVPDAAELAQAMMDYFR